jgi:arylsulfatase A-like enzyme
MKKFDVRVVVISASLLVGTQTPAEAAYTVKPKVGQCFMYSNAEVSAPFATKNPISCSKTHNMETYLVGKWPLTTPPEEMAEGEGLEVANSLCMAWGKGGKLTDSPFTFWAWYTPDPTAWAKGERWLRCDAMITVDENEPRKFVSWKGQKLKKRTNL